MKPAALIVDDSPDDLFALRAALEPAGIDVDEAANGEEALRLLLKRDYSIVIMDLLMPRMNGFEVCGLIRRRERFSEMPILILSGFDEEGARDLPGYRPGCCEFVRKPVDPEVLCTRVAAAIKPKAP